MESEGDLNETLILLVLGQVPGVGDPEERGLRWKGEGKKVPEPPVWGPSPWAGDLSLPPLDRSLYTLAMVKCCALLQRNTGSF